jgi:hypothetical protein
MSGYFLFKNSTHEKIRDVLPPGMVTAQDTGKPSKLEQLANLKVADHMYQNIS